MFIFMITKVCFRYVFFLHGQRSQTLKFTTHTVWVIETHTALFFCAENLTQVLMDETNEMGEKLSDLIANMFRVEDHLATCKVHA